MVLLITTFVSSEIFAQENNDYYVEHYTKNNGLPFNEISLITEDSNGFFWIFTYGGAARWNGNTFKKIKDPETGMYSQIKSVWGIGSYQNKIILNRANRYFYIDSLSTIKPYFNLKNVYIPPKGDGIDWKRLEEICDKLPLNQKSKISQEISFLKCNPNSIMSYVVNDTLTVITSNAFSCLFVSPSHIYSATQQESSHLNLLIGKHLFRLYDNSDVALVTPDTASKVSFKLPIKKWKYALKYFGFNTNSGYYFRYNEFILKLSFINGNLKCDTLLKNIKDDFLCIHVSEKNGIILIGTKNGLYKYQKKYFTIKNEVTKTKSNHIYSHLITPSFVVTNQNITSRLPELNYKNWIWGDVGSMVKLKNGNILANVLYELILFNSSLNPVKRWPINEKSIHSMVEIDNKVFFGGKNIGWVDIKTGKLNIIPIQQNFGNVEINRLIKADIPHTLLVLVNGYIYRLNIINGSFKKLFPYKFKYVNFIHYDQAKQIFIVGDKINGITLLSNTGLYRHLPLDHNSNFLNAHYILQDKDHDYWIPTNGGLYLIRSNTINRFIKTNNINTFTYDYVGKQLGIEEDEFNGGFTNCGLKFGDSMSLASMGGLVQFDISLKNKLEKTKNKILIEQIFIDNVLVEPNSSNLISLEPNYKNLKIEFDYGGIGNVNNSLYYRMNGSNDTNWYLLESDHLIINRLTEGNYTLEFSTDKTVNYSTARLKIEVKPFWYRTKWFIISLLFLVILIVYFLIYFKVEQVKGREAMKLDRQRMKLFSVIAHDLRTPVNTYNSVVETIEFLLKMGRYEDVKTIGLELNKSSRSLQLLLNNLLHWSLKQQELIKLKSENISVKSTFNELMGIYQPIADFKNIKIKFEQTEEISLYKNKLSFDMLMRNILDNCIKHSLQDSVVGIKIYNKNNIAVFEIDSISKVSVLSEEVQEFKILIEDHHSTKMNDGSQSIGYIIIRESLKQINAYAFLEINTIANDLKLKVCIPLSTQNN